MTFNRKEKLWLNKSRRKKLRKPRRKDKRRLQ
jgi:hypothetical protein